MIDPKAFGPSKRHVFKYTHTTSGGIEHCQRCGCYYRYADGGTAAVYCSPKPEWLRVHPDDDMRER